MSFVDTVQVVILVAFLAVLWAWHRRSISPSEQLKTENARLFGNLQESEEDLDAKSWEISVLRENLRAANKAVQVRSRKLRFLRERNKLLADGAVTSNAVALAEAVCVKGTVALKDEEIIQLVVNYNKARAAMARRPAVKS